MSRADAPGGRRPGGTSRTRQVAAGLAHHPDGNAVRALAAGGPQDAVVLQRRKLGHGEGNLGAERGCRPSNGYALLAVLLVFVVGARQL